jgi:uncharacterized protein
VLASYRLPLAGIHGPAHWARVLENGRRLAPVTGADIAVVELFALFHDSQRGNENLDPGHGARGGQLAGSLRELLPGLTDPQVTLLTEACALHTRGFTEADVTVATCWDADRLDLGRVGIRPRATKLCTAAASDPETIAWAHDRAWSGFIPRLLREEWGFAVPGH